MQTYSYSGELVPFAIPISFTNTLLTLQCMQTTNTWQAPQVP